MPVKEKWWDDVIKSHIADYYQKPEEAKKDNKKDSSPKGGRKGSYIWGDRVRIIEKRISDGVCKVSGRGKEYWVNDRHLGGEELLEVYVIDVGQGDGLLVVTPEGHNIMIDGGNTRKFQNSGKNAADFVDWKFFKDYLSFSDRNNPNKTKIHLDAMVATHNDIDHFGGLYDLINLEDEKNKAELSSNEVFVEALYHAGLSWWYDGKSSKGKVKRSLGKIANEHYTQLLNDRQSNGAWGQFIKASTKLKKKDGEDTTINRISTKTNNFLPGFNPTDGKCSIRVLGPIETITGDSPSLKKFPDGDSKNTNGHSVVLRLDYGNRRILLTGDLNTHSQNHIMDHFGDDFITEYKSDVAKGCHHGSHDVSYKFLEGLRPLCTVISSGDAESHDHPRPTIISASAITGRRLIDTKKDSLICPLIYITEVARSVSISKIGAMKEYDKPVSSFNPKEDPRAKLVHNDTDEMAKFRLFLGSNPSSPFHKPRLDNTKVVRGLRYGLINVRTDGKDLFFAQREESGKDWAYTVLTEKQIEEAR